MNRHVTKPIRTYGRETFKEVTVPIPKLINSFLRSVDNKHVLLSEKLSDNEKEKTLNNSMQYDPFDTTFDKILKNTKIPPSVPKASNNTASLNSRNSSFVWDSSISNKSDQRSLFNVSSNFNKKSSSKKVQQKTVKVKLMNKNLVKKKKTRLDISKKFKVQKDNSHKEYKVHKRRNKKEIILDNSDFDFKLSGNKSQDVENGKQQRNKSCIKKHLTKTKRKNKNVQRPHFLDNVKIKPCFVSLDKCKISKQNSKLNLIEDTSLKEADKCAINIDTLPNQHDTNEMNSYDANYSKHTIKNCSVKLERLRIGSFAEPPSSSERYEHVLSSTPNGRFIRPSTHFISVSPIIATNKDSLETMRINESSYRNSSMIVHKAIETRKTVFDDLTDVANLGSCNLSYSEPINGKNTNSQPTYTCNGTSNDIKLPIEKEPLVENVQNKMHDCSPVTKEKYLLPNMEMKEQYLSFAIDTYRSRSLFTDSSESLQNLSYTDNMQKEIVETSGKNSMSHINDRVLSNEICATPIELTSTVKLNAAKHKRVSFSTQQDVPKIVVENSQIKKWSDQSSDSGECITEIKEDDCKNSYVLNSIEETLPNKIQILNANDSLVDNVNGGTIGSSDVVSKQLEDPVRITRRRKYTNWDFGLDSIAEDCSGNPSITNEQVCLKSTSRTTKRILPRKTLMSLENIADKSSNSLIKESVFSKESVFLKPGKSWARSLSILNNVHGQFNLDKLSVGKGRKWRHSVQDILNMQKQGIIQSCLKRTDDDQELQIHVAPINKAQLDLVNNFGRISRRISVRVVPIHKTVKCIDDAPFLEVYGIIPVKNQRFTLVNNSKKFSTCNTQTNYIDGENNEEPIVSTAKEVILQRCLQTDYISFPVYFSDSYLENCRKIGEGVYGEVFLYEREDTKSVIKIIPIEGSEYVNGEPQKKFHEILSEIVIAMELHNLRFNTKYNTDGFVEVKNIKCIKGKYPEKLIELWNIYDEEKHSDNDCPSMFNDDQLYIVLELGHGGQDLEAFVFNTAEEAHVLFIQAALALAVAEKAVQFEHRDLHWGNILISSTDESYIRYKLGKKDIALMSKGVKVSIIDFTLSRVTYQNCNVFNDLASDPTLFTAQGEYQFEIYRLMKDKVKNNWQKFEPYTNILWLHYTVDKMITAVRYRRKNLKIHKQGIAKLTELKNEILLYNSAFDLVTNCDKIVNLLCINT